MLFVSVGDAPKVQWRMKNPTLFKEKRRRRCMSEQHPFDAFFTQVHSQWLASAPPPFSRGGGGAKQKWWWWRIVNDGNDKENDK